MSKRNEPTHNKLPILAGLIWCCLAWAALGQSIGGMSGISAGGRIISTAYAGPGDVVSGASAWWGLRCYSSAYSGNIADVWDSATGSTTETLLTCSSGGTINQTVNPLSTTCAVACSVKTIYDQSGAAQCSAAACNLTQATNANRPTLTLNCLNPHPCMTVTATQTLASANTFPSLTQPDTYSFVAKRTGSAASFFTVITGQVSGGGQQVGFNSVSGEVLCYAGTIPTITGATENVFHAIQCALNGASSSANVDGTETTGLNSGAGGSGGGSIALNATNPLAGAIAEGGVWPVGFSTVQQNSMHVNQSGYWGTP